MSLLRSDLSIMALGWMAGLPDAAKLGTALASLLAVGFSAGTIGTATIFTKEVEAVKATQEHLAVQNAGLRQDLIVLERRVIRESAADSVRFAKMVCLLTDARNLSGIDASRVCGL